MEKIVAYQSNGNAKLANLVIIELVTEVMMFIMDNLLPSYCKTLQGRYKGEKLINNCIYKQQTPSTGLDLQLTKGTLLLQTLVRY